MSVERIQQHFRENAAVHREALDTLAFPVAAAIDVLFGNSANQRTRFATMKEEQPAAQFKAPRKSWVKI